MVLHKYEYMQASQWIHFIGRYWDRFLVGALASLETEFFAPVFGLHSDSFSTWSEGKKFYLYNRGDTEYPSIILEKYFKKGFGPNWSQTEFEF